MGFGILLPLLLAGGDSYTVSPGGDDGAPGTAERPFRTIQRAADRARAGDTILVRAGVYPEKITLQRSGEEGRPITLRNHPGERPVVETRVLLQAREGHTRPIGWIVIEGLEIRNGWDGIKFYNAHHLVIRGNHIHDNPNQGILGNGHHVAIEGNVIARNGLRKDNEKSNLEHGIYATGNDFRIVNNVIHSNRAYGIQVAAYPFKEDSHAGPEFAGASRWLISHNTIAFNRNRGAVVVWQEGARDCVIQNNVFYENAAEQGKGACHGVTFYSGPGHVVRNNVFFAPGRRALEDAKGGVFAESGNLEVDPSLEDPAKGDFRLRKGSPALDAGTGERPLESDHAGTARPQGAGHDIGAFERAVFP